MLCHCCFALPHSHSQRLHSFWSAPRITNSGQVWFFQHVQRICFILSANQFFQTWLSACAEWQEVSESQTSGVGPCQRSQFLVLTKRSPASGDENGFALVVLLWVALLLLLLVCPLPPASWFMVGLCPVMYTYSPFRVVTPLFAFCPHSLAHCLLCCQLAPTLHLNIA